MRQLFAGIVSQRNTNVVPMTIKSGYTQYSAQNTLMSPVMITAANDYVNVCLWKDGFTYTVYQSRYTTRPFAQAKVITYDERYGIDRPYMVGQPLYANDDHPVPAMAFDSTGRMYVVQENLHSTPLLVYKAVHDDYSLYETIAEQIGTAIAYPKNIPFNNDFFIWHRGSSAAEFSAYVIFSNNGMEGWGSQVRVTQKTGNIRHYETIPMNNFVNDTYYLVVSFRNDVDPGLAWFRHCLLKVDKSDIVLSGNTVTSMVFKNYNGSFSQEVVASGPIIEPRLIEAYQYYYTGSDSTQGNVPLSCVSPTGIFYAVHGRGDGTNYVMVIVTDTNVTNRDINIANLVGGEDIVTRSGQTGPFRAIVAFSDDYIELYALVDEGTYNKIHRFSSTNQGDSWTDLGAVAPDWDVDQWACIFPRNIMDIPKDRNFSIVLTKDEWAGDGTTADAVTSIVKKAAFGSVKTEPAPAVTPASTLDTANTLFHYKAVDASITRSGNNVLTMVDLSGNGRTATAVNNPQWNGSNVITTNGTNSYFTIPVTGLTALSKGTFMCVARANAVNSVIMAFSDNTSNNEYIWMGLNNTTLNGGAGGAAYTIIAGGGTARLTSGQDVTGNNVYHLLTIVMNGRTLPDIYVDGKKQHYFNDTTTTAEEALQGKFTAAITTVNAINIGRVDRTTDIFWTVDFKEIVLFNEVFDFATMRSFHQKLANDHSITLQSQFT